MYRSPGGQEQGNLQTRMHAKVLNLVPVPSPPLPQNIKFKTCTLAQCSVGCFETDVAYSARDQIS